MYLPVAMTEDVMTDSTVVSQKSILFRQLFQFFWIRILNLVCIQYHGSKARTGSSINVIQQFLAEFLRALIVIHIFNLL